MALPSEQVVVGDSVRLSSGDFILKSRLRDIVQRCRECRMQNRKRMQDRKRMYTACEVAVIKQYGKRCYDCEDVIVIDYGVEPILRPLTKDDAESNEDDTAWFHKYCWSLYDQYKAEIHRRSSYSDLTPPQAPQPPGPLQPLADVVVEAEPPTKMSRKDVEAEDNPPALDVEGQHTESQRSG